MIDAWERDREPSPLWVHWFRLIASMGSEVSGRAHSGMFSGTIHELKGLTVV